MTGSFFIVTDVRCIVWLRQKCWIHWFSRRNVAAKKHSKVRVWMVQDFMDTDADDSVLVT